MIITDKEIKSIQADALAAINLPSSAFDRLLDLLQKDENLDAFNAPKMLGISGHKTEPLLRLLNNKYMKKEHMLILLSAISSVRDKVTKSMDEIEICWTGPPSLEVVAKSTDSVIGDMIKRARREILIVGYRITDSDITLKKIADAMMHVNGIIMVIDNDKKRTNLTSINDAFKGIGRPRIYIHKKKEKGFYKVHAKIIIIDGKEMLLTSANITHHGLKRNFEMGVRTLGSSAKDAHSLVMKMIDEKYFEEI